MYSTSMDAESVPPDEASCIIDNVLDVVANEDEDYTLALVQPKGKSEAESGWVSFSTLGPEWMDYWKQKKQKIDAGELKPFDHAVLRRSQSTGHEPGSTESHIEDATPESIVQTKQYAEAAQSAVISADNSGSMSPGRDAGKGAGATIALKEDQKTESKEITGKLTQVVQSEGVGGSTPATEAAASRAKTSAGDTSTATIRQSLSPRKKSQTPVPKAVKHRPGRRLKPGLTLDPDDKIPKLVFADKPDVDIDALLKQKQAEDQQNSAVNSVLPKKRKAKIPNLLDGDTAAKHIKIAKIRAEVQSHIVRPAPGDTALAVFPEKAKTYADSAVRPSPLALAVATVKGNRPADVRRPLQSIASALQNGDVRPGEDTTSDTHKIAPAAEKNNSTTKASDLRVEDQAISPEAKTRVKVEDRAFEAMQSVVVARPQNATLPPSATTAFRIPKGRAAGNIDMIYRQRFPPRPPRRRSASPRTMPVLHDAPENTATDFATWAAHKTVTCSAWARNDCPRTERDCMYRHAYFFHGNQEPMPPSDRVTCAFWLNGHCKRTDCWFAHRDTGIHVMRGLRENERMLRNIFAGLQHAQTARDIDAVSQAYSTVRMSSIDQSRDPRLQGIAPPKETLARPAIKAEPHSVVSSNAAADHALALPQHDKCAQVLARLFQYKADPITVRSPTYGSAANALVIQPWFLSKQECEAARNALGAQAGGELESGTDWLKQTSKFRWSDQMGYIDDCPKLLLSQLSAGSQDEAKYILLKWVQGSLLIARDCPATRKALKFSALPKPSKHSSVLFRVFSNAPWEGNPKPIVYANNSALLSFDVGWLHVKDSESDSALMVWLLTKDVYDREAVALRSLLAAQGFTVTIINEIPLSESATDGVFIFCSKTRWDKIPGLYKHLRNDHRTYGMRDWKKEEKHGLLSTCIKLFPPTIGMLVTNEVFQKPESALKVIQKFRQLEIDGIVKRNTTKERGKTGLLFVPPWLEEYLKWLQDNGGSKVHDDVLKAWRDLDTKDVCELRYEGGKNWIDLFSDSSMLVSIRGEGQRFADLLVKEFVLWTVTHADRVGRHIVIHESAAAPGTRDPYGWMQMYGHLDVLTPEQWLAREA